MEFHIFHLFVCLIAKNDKQLEIFFLVLDLSHMYILFFSYPLKRFLCRNKIHNTHKFINSRGIFTIRCTVAKPRLDTRGSKKH